MQKQTFATVVEAQGDEPSITISSSALDRDQDVIVPEGVDLTAYRKNPVVGWQHFRGDPLPIGATTSIEVEPGKGIKARWKWLEGDSIAARVKNAFDQGVIRAASVGFLPTQWSDIRETGGRRYEKWQLTEWSLVAVPSNPEAVRVLRALDLWDEEPVIALVAADEPVEVDERDFVPALRTAMREAFALARASRLDAAGLAGFDGDRAATHREPLYAIDPRALAHGIADVLRAHDARRREMIDAAVTRELRRIQGRVD